MPPTQGAPNARGRETEWKTRGAFPAHPLTLDEEQRVPFPAGTAQAAGSAKAEMGVWKANKGREGKYLGEKIESITSLLGGAGGVCTPLNGGCSHFDLPEHLVRGHWAVGQAQSCVCLGEGDVHPKPDAVSHAPQPLSFKALKAASALLKRLS